MKKDTRTSDASLHQKALEFIEKKLTKRELTHSESEMYKFIHELSLHQVELELQNEELSCALFAKNNTYQTNFNLSDSTLTGFIALSETCFILEINNVGASSLGNLQSFFVGKNFRSFISEISLPDFNKFFNQQFKSKVKESCEIELSVSAKPKIDVCLTSISTDNADQCLISFIDITKLKQAEEKLRISEERWKCALETATSGMWDWDIIAGRVFYSSQWKAMLGYTDCEVGDTLEDWNTRVHPDDIENVLTVLKLHLNGESESYSSEHRMVCKDGSYIWVLDEGKVVERDEKGKALRAIGTHKDITRLKKNEFDLQERMKELNIHKSISELMSSTSFSTDEVIEKIIEIIPGGWQFSKNAEARIQIHNTSYKTSGFKTTDHSLKCDIKTGNKVIGEVEVCYIGHISGYSNDVFLPEEKDLLFSIAERLGNFIARSEKDFSLSESEHKYRNLVENITDVIYEIDNAGIITNISSTIEKIIGYTAEELIGKNFSHFVGINKEYLAKRLKELSLKNELENEYKIRTKSGGSCWVRLTITAMLRNGKLIGAFGILIDITEKKQVELELQKSESLYRSILQASPDTIFISDLIGNVLFTSSMAEKMFGYENTGLQINIPLFDFIDVKDHDKARNAISLMFQGIFTGATEYKGIKADGSLFDIEVNGEFIKDEEGIPVNMVFVVRDISDRKLAEQKLKKSEEKYRKLIESINDVVFDVHLDGTIKFVSPSIEKLINLKPENLIGQKFFSFVYPEDIAFLIDVFKNNLFDGYKRIECRCIAQTGEIIWVQVSAQYSYEDGKIVGRTGVLHDITEQKHAEEKLRKSEEQYRKLVESVNDVIYEIDATGTIKFVSPSVIRVLGYSVEEVTGRNIFDFIYQEDQSDIRNSFGNLSSREYSYLEYRYVRKDSSIHWVRSSTSSTLENGIVVGGTGILTDITERKIAELELVKSKEKTEESEKKFIAIIQSQTEGIGIVDKNECFEFVNLAAEKIFETNPGELIGKSLMDFLSAEEKEKINNETRNRGQGIENTYDLQIVSKNKNPKYIHVSAVPKFDENNNYQGAYGVFQDITERKKVESALQNSEEKFSKAFQTSPYAIWITGVEDGKFFEINDSFTAHTGYAKEEVYADSTIGLKLWADIEDRNCVVADLNQGKEVLAREYKFVKKSGKNIFCIFSASVILLNNKRYILSSVTDISEIKLSQDQLRKLSRAVEQNPVSIVITDLDGNIEYANPKACETTGYALGELIGQNPRLLKSGETLTNEYDVLWGNISTGNEWHGVFHNRRKNGELYWESSTLSPITDMEGKITHYLAIKEDVTKRKETEEALSKREEDLNYAQNIARMGSWEHNLVTNKLNGSKYYYNMLGLQLFEKEDMLFEYFVSLIHPDDISIFKELHQDIYIKNETKIVDFRIVLPDGKTKWLQNNIVPVYDGDTLVALKGVNIDITERKLSEQTFQNERILLRTMIDNFPDKIYAKDLDSRITLSNKADLQLMRVTSESEVIGKTDFDFFPKELADGFFTNEQLMMQTGIPLINKEEYIVDKDEVERCMLTSKIPLRDWNGQIIGLIGIGRDITERKQAEKEISELNANLEYKIELRTTELAKINSSLLKEIEDRKRIEKALSESEYQYRSVVENVNEVIFKTDAEGLWLFLNISWETVTGFSIDESLGKLFVNYVHPDDRKRNMELFEPLLNREKEYCRHKVRYITKDGGFRWIEVFARLSLNEMDEVTGMFGTLQDITDRKRAEDFEDELLELSLQLTGIPGHEISSAINMALKRIGSFLDSDRAYIFELNPVEKTMSNTYEWCNKGITPEIDNLKDIPVEIFPMRMEQLHRFENIIIPAVSNLPESWNAEREILEPQGIKSLIVIPVFIDINLIGFVGLDSVSKQKEYDSSEINILQVWSNMLAGLINNQRKELIIEQTRRNYETFFNTIDDFLFVLDVQGNILHTNNTVINRLGYAPAELLGISVLMVHPADRREEAGRIVGEMLAGTADFCPVPLLTKANAHISVETRVKHGFWDGKPVIFGVSKDVSKIKLSEEKFSRAFQSNSAMMAISSIATGKFIEINDAYVRTLGYSREEIIGQTAIDFDIYLDSETRDKIYDSLKQNIPIRELEIRTQTKSGNSLTGIFSADKILIGDDPCILTLLVDITDRKIAEEELKKAQIEADKANLAKSEFLSRMSHELRTPMNSILGFAQLMEMGELIPAHRKGVNHILKSGKHLLDLINEVLDILRIEAGRISLSIEPVRLSNIILEMLDIVHPQAMLLNVSIKLIDSPSNQLFVLADNQRLKQVLLNLINNAVKYNHDGGSVQIETELRKPETGGKPRIRISVVDTGIGIKPEEMYKLFLPFERIGAERTETEGTGLGLNVVKRLMDAMEGKVGATSIPDEGSTFWIELEHVDSRKFIGEKTLLATKQKTTEVNKSGTILYFEDNISNIELIDGIIEDQRPHIQLVTSISGINAVNLAKNSKPGLILLDLDLPEIHGSEVMANLQANKQTMSIPVVIISADAMSHQIKKMLNAGAKDYLTKPFEISVFLKMVDKWI